MKENFSAKKEAFTAWQNGKCSDSQLALAISSLDEAIETLQAMGDGGHFLTGMHLSLQSMISAQDSRGREGRFARS